MGYLPSSSGCVIKAINNSTRKIHRVSITYIKLGLSLVLLFMLIASSLTPFNYRKQGNSKQLPGRVATYFLLSS